MTDTTTTAPPRAVLPLPAAAARYGTAVGAVATLASTFLAWTWTAEFPGDLTVTGYPGGLQVLTLTGALLTLLLALSALGIRGLRWLTPGGTTAPVLLLALGTFGTTGYTLGAISYRLGGVVNLEPGAWVAGIASLLTVLCALGIPADQDDETTATGAWARLRSSLRAPAARPATISLPSWAEILLIAVAFGLALYVFTYGIDTEYVELFTGYLILVVLGGIALTKTGLPSRLTALTAKHRTIALTAAFVAAAAFPFTQTNDTYTNVAANILVFATVALGLNVVVGLAGLLDLGYVAFLGVGAYAAALVSGSPDSTIGVHFPFWAAVLTGAAASLVFGIVIGAPTLRLRGDYLAIVTLGFGEIFRITMNNLDGDSGPDVTNGPNGIPNIPDLKIFGFDLGETHTVLGVDLGRFANYYL
ncbi:branched-chain amino acid ABC transporter permease, partial [Streptomyces sp. SID5785]